MRKFQPLAESRFDWFGEDLAKMIEIQRREAAEQANSEPTETPGEPRTKEKNGKT